MWAGLLCNLRCNDARDVEYYSRPRARYLVSSDLVPRHLRVLVMDLKANTGNFDNISGRQRRGHGSVGVVISVAGARLTSSIIVRPRFLVGGGIARDPPAIASACWPQGPQRPFQFENTLSILPSLQGCLSSKMLGTVPFKTARSSSFGSLHNGLLHPL